MRKHRRVGSVCDCASDDRRYERAEPCYVTFSVGVDTICKEHDERLAGRIEPDAGPSEAGVTERTDGKEISAI